MSVNCTSPDCQPLCSPLQEINSGEIITYFAEDRDSGAGRYFRFHIDDVSLKVTELQCVVVKVCNCSVFMAFKLVFHALDWLLSSTYLSVLSVWFRIEFTHTILPLLPCSQLSPFPLDRTVVG